MNKIFFFLSRLFAGPLSLLTGPVGFFRDVYRSSGSGKSFLLAIPAIFVAFLFGALMLVSQMGRESRLTQQYDRLALTAETRAKDLFPEYRRAIRLFEVELAKERRNNPAPASGNDSAAGIRLGPEAEAAKVAFESVRERIRAVHEEERLYLRKLMDVAPDNETYQYRYAVSHVPEDEAVAQRLLVAMAPMETEEGNARGVGNPSAHLWLAELYFTRAQANPQGRDLNLLQVEKHTSQCLVRESSNTKAREMRAFAFKARKELARAYDDFAVLFENNPKYFVQLNALNEMMGRKERVDQVLESAELRLHADLTASREDLTEWEGTLEFYSACMMQRRRFVQLRQELINERSTFADDELKRKFVDNILDQASRERISQLLATAATNKVDAEEAVSILEDSAKSGQLSDGMEYFTATMTRSLPEFADRIRGVYDYRSDPDPSGLILIELATDALLEQRYPKAIELLEQARMSIPDSPIVMNNLAFAYLSAENANPARALELVDQAIRVMGNPGEGMKERASFLHTRGLALLQLGRADEAMVALREALRVRPGHAGTLQLLIQCCEGRDEVMKQIYQQELDRILAAQNPAPAPEVPAPSATDSSGN